MDIARVMANLYDRGFIPHYSDTGAHAVEQILELIGEKDAVGFSGSKTVETLKIPYALHNRGNKVFHKLISPETDKDELYKASRDADWLISSSNAMSEDGQLVNIDGKGNRVASMIYGPKNVIVVIGINKIAPDLNAAVDRAKNIAAPLNARRFNLSTPCTLEGKCADCRSAERICRATMILTNPTYNVNFHIIIVNENLGF